MRENLIVQERHRRQITYGWEIQNLPSHDILWFNDKSYFETLCKFVWYEHYLQLTHLLASEWSLLLFLKVVKLLFEGFKNSQTFTVVQDNLQFTGERPPAVLFREINEDLVRAFERVDLPDARVVDVSPPVFWLRYRTSHSNCVAQLQACRRNTIVKQIKTTDDLGQGHKKLGGFPR